MSARPLPAHLLNRLGIAFLIAALACWIGFHFLLIDSRMRGWELWNRIWVILTRGSLPPWRSMIAISAIVMTAVLVTVSPFITFLLRTSRPCHWLAIVASGAALLGFLSLILKVVPDGLAIPFLLAAMSLNFLGLICLRSPRFEVGANPSQGPSTSLDDSPRGQQ